MRLIINFLSLILVVLASNNTQSIHINGKNCYFIVQNTSINFTFFYCSTQLSQNITGWIQCIQYCCYTISTTQYPNPDYDALLSCRDNSKIDLNQNNIAIMIYFGVGLVCATLAICIICILARAFISYLNNKVSEQHVLNTQQIEWQIQSTKLTVSKESLIWILATKKLSQLYNSQCSICLQNGCATKLFCKHAYHAQCIGHWLIKSNFCPLCHLSNIRSIKQYCIRCDYYYIICRKQLFLKELTFFNNIICQNCNNNSQSINLKQINFNSSYQVSFAESNTNIQI